MFDIDVRCSGCGRPFDSATAADGNETVDGPAPGDFMVCIGCACVNRLEEDGRLAAVDLAAVDDHSRDVLRRMQAAACEIRNNGGGVT